MCNRDAVRLCVCCGIWKWRFCFPSSQLPPITGRACEEQDEAGPFRGLLLLPTGGVERHPGQMLTGEALVGGGGVGAVSSVKWRFRFPPSSSSGLTDNSHRAGEEQDDKDVVGMQSQA